jgi:hypothetical protein
MDVKNTLADLQRNADRWHAMLAAWIGGRPKTSATIMIVAGTLAAWKVVELVTWVT